jgi:DNA-binding MarR family transcriptional regulator
MSAGDQFQAVLQEWTDLFLRRSMRNIIHFSRERGVSIPQIGALFQIRQRGVCSVSDIGAELGITSAAASQMLETLVQEELVRRTEDPNDRRAKQIVITEKGRRLLQESIRARQGWSGRLVDSFSVQEQAQITAALRLLIERLKGIDPEKPAGG